MVAVLRKVYGGCNAPVKVAGTRDASNGGRMRVRIIIDSTLVKQNSYTCCKNLLIIKTNYYAHAPRGIDW